MCYSNEHDRMMSPLEHVSQSDALFLRISGCSPATVHSVDFILFPSQYLRYIWHNRQDATESCFSEGCVQICLCCTLLCQMVPLQYSSSSYLHHLAGLPLDRSLMVIPDVHHVSRIILMCSDQVHSSLLFCSITSMIFVLTFTHVCFSVPVCHV